MKRIVRLLLLTLAATSLMYGQSSGSDEKAITRIENDWAVALAKGDVAWVGQILAPEYMYSGADGSLMSGTQMMADFKAGYVKYASFKIDELKVIVIGDTALALGVDTEKSSYKGADTSGQYRYTDVFVKQKGTWKAVASQATLIPKH